MSNISIELAQLRESLEIIYVAFCIQCGKEEESHEKHDFIKKLHDKGWRVSNVGDVYCPKCSLKFVSNANV